MKKIYFIIIVFVALIMIIIGLLFNKTNTTNNKPFDYESSLRDYCYKKTKNQNCKDGNIEKIDDKYILNIKIDDLSRSIFSISIENKKINVENISEEKPIFTYND